MPEHLRAMTLIGDVVASRQTEDRSHVQDRLTAALAQVNAAVPAVQPLETTLGDEFQGAYAEPAQAVRASLLLRLTLLPTVDTRYGLGWGGLTVFDAGRRPVSQDGPAWWAARAAVQHVHATAGRRGQARLLRTWCVDQGAEPWPREAPQQGLPGTAGQAALVNAFLLVRDELVGQQTARARRLLLGVLQGHSQQRLAEDEGVTQSAVSQQLARSGAHAVRAALDALDEAAAWSS